MRLVKLTQQKLKDLNAYLVIVKEQYEENPSPELKEALDQTLDTIELLEEDMEELI